MSKLSKLFPKGKNIKSPLDLYGYIAYLAAIIFITSANFISGTVRIVLAVSTNVIFLVILYLTHDSDKRSKK
jgi:hypothetical protein